MTPDPPRNVQLVTRDGSIPVDCTYEGVNDEGLHVWRAHVPGAAAAESITVDALPARTTILFDLGADE